MTEICRLFYFLFRKYLLRLMYLLIIYYGMSVNMETVIANDISKQILNNYSKLFGPRKFS